jgi:hypothetical protein
VEEFYGFRQKEQAAAAAEERREERREISLITSVKDITVVIKLELNEIKDDEVGACIDGTSSHSLATLCSSLLCVYTSHFYYFIFGWFL